MQFTYIMFSTLIAVSFVEGSAIAGPALEVPSSDGYCGATGDLCHKLKRGLGAITTHITEIASRQLKPGKTYGSCYRVGEMCGKAKRDALALAEATAEALLAADPQAQPCYAAGSPCSLAEREALDASETAALSFRNRSKRSTNEFCYGAEGPCSKLKRAAEAVAEAIAEPNPDLEAEPWSVQGSEQKRALDDLNSLLDRILLR